MTNLYHAKNGHLVPVARKRLANEDQLQAWIAANPRLIGLELLVLGREVPTEFGGRIDILGLDQDGNAVIIECKRDRTPRDIIAQILDYASWVAALSTRKIHEIAQAKLGKSLETAFQERFGTELPEALNESHSLVIVASEFDASSRRIVEYLAEVHEVGINTAFFNTFEHDGETFLATDWLLDQEEVTQRAESKAKAPWSGLWYFNVGQDNERNWEDLRKYGFISAGGSRYYSDPLKRLSPGDRVCAYQKQSGYVGFGIVTGPSVPVRDFTVNDTPILKLPLQARGFGHEADDLDKCEYLVSVEWLKTYPLSEAKTFTGVFANQNIVCKLRDAATIEFLKGVFPLEAESTRSRAASAAGK
ncbi:MAG: endonuclease NucS domain-containing protein [Terriglobales bacterium]